MSIKKLLLIGGSIVIIALILVNWKIVFFDDRPAAQVEKVSEQIPVVTEQKIKSVTTQNQETWTTYSDAEKRFSVQHPAQFQAKISESQGLKNIAFKSLSETLLSIATQPVNARWPNLDVYLNDQFLVTKGSDDLPSLRRTLKGGLEVVEVTAPELAEYQFIGQLNTSEFIVFTFYTNNKEFVERILSSFVLQEQLSTLKDCFTSGPLAANMDTTGWKVFEDLGFLVRYPDGSVTLVHTGNFSFDISSQLSSHKAQIKVYRLNEDMYRARYLHSPWVKYEFFSNTWRQDEGGGKQCNPNARGTTAQGNSIYSTADGDVGAFFVNYFVVFHNTPQGGNYEPVVIEFKTSGDANDANYSTYPAFQKVLENIIKTVEIRPTKK